jgi:hypothetical protein
MAIVTKSIESNKNKDEIKRFRVWNWELYLLDD